MKEARDYSYIEVPHVWYSLPSLLSNVTSLRNKGDELTVTVRAASADIVGITEAWQIVPEVCSIENYQLFHHLRTVHRGEELLCSATVLSVLHYSVLICLTAWKHCG